MGRRVERRFIHWADGTMRTVPYEAFVPHGIADWRLSISDECLAACGAAFERLADTASRVVVTPLLAWCLNRVEGIASSSVEGIATTLRSLSLLESMSGPDPGREASRAADRHGIGAVRLNALALDLGARGARHPVSVDDITTMHRRLFEGTDQETDSGWLRHEQNWIGDVDLPTPVGARFVPPPPSDVEPLMDDLAEYMSAHPWQHPPLVKMTLAHLQLETIHPFDDGNGRVGRALMHLALRRDAQVRLPIPLAAAVDANRSQYYDTMIPYQNFVGSAEDDERARCFEAALRYTMRAVEVACSYTDYLADRTAAVLSDWEALGLRSDSAASEILSVMTTMPAVGIDYLVEKTGRPPRSVRRGLSRLIHEGCISESIDPESNRRVFEIPKIINLIDQRRPNLLHQWHPQNPTPQHP